MRCERVARPTWRGVKRAEDSVEEDIRLVLRSKLKSWVCRRIGSEAGSWSWLVGVRHNEPPTSYTPKIPKMCLTWEISEIYRCYDYGSWSLKEG